MSRDLLFKTDDFIFSYRVAAVMKRDGRVLLQREAGNEAYSFPGGHVAYGETNEETLLREFIEETGLQIQVGNLAWVGEIFFPWGELPCHQICLYYEADCMEDSILLETFGGLEKRADGSSRLIFEWVPLERVQSLTLYPEQAKEFLWDDSGTVRHFVDRQDVVF